ncbi:subclass B1 metallo-beta-lactamase [Flagellimonas sp. DF-77]|uniref:subclass B1 metallo-beta-lactamase n=1 Tax=Flagellimonas algarum TaxID=3230298 RepID=UPI00339B411B
MHSTFKSLVFVFAALTLATCSSREIWISKDLKILSLSAPRVYQHLSFLQTEDYGKVACNGMIIVNGNEAVIIDTPVNNKESEALIDWVTKHLDVRVIGVVATHFHNDCLGGLEAFHQREIPSYASNLTKRMAEERRLPIPKFGFDTEMTLTIGGLPLALHYLGEGHTKDNIVVYDFTDRVLFGGCLVKSVGASKGYLGDANVAEWPATVKIVKETFIEAEIIVPGHGSTGGMELLDYTIALFEE